MTVDDKILDWLGFKLGECNTLLDPEGVLVEVYPQGGKPAIGLDFLFEYAYPELKKGLSPLKLQLWLGEWIMRIVYHNEDAVVAFKAALIKVIDND